MAYTYGIDVSGWDQLVNWDKLRNQGFSYAFIKASQGQGIDSTFKLHWQGAKDSSILRAAYHFYVQDVDPHIQAQTLLGLLQGDPGELPPIVDVEHERRWDKDTQQIITIPIVNHTSYINNLHVMLGALEAGLNRRPLIYTGSGFWNGEISNNGNFTGWASNYELWVANYINLPYPVQSMLTPEKIQAVVSDIEQNKFHGFPSMPSSWNRWVFWQFSGDAYFLDGLQTHNADNNIVNAHLDLNVFAGTPEDLRIWAHLDPVATPIPNEEQGDVVPPQSPSDSTLLVKTLTNQQMINVFFRAFGVDDYWNIVIQAGLASMADDRLAPYTGLSIDELPLDESEKDALKRILA